MNDSPNARSEPVKTHRTWHPIILGVASGIAAFWVFARHEPSVFWQLTAWLFHEQAPVKIVEPRTIHIRLFMLTLALIGGVIGVFLSRWQKAIAIPFLLACLAVLALFSTRALYIGLLPKI